MNNAAEITHRKTAFCAAFCPRLCLLRNADYIQSLHYCTVEARRHTLDSVTLFSLKGWMYALEFVSHTAGLRRRACKTGVKTVLQKLKHPVCLCTDGKKMS